MYKHLSESIRFFVLSLMVSGVSFAQSQSAPNAPKPVGFTDMLVPFALMFGVIYFLTIRPQQKKVREQQELLGALKHGDDIVTTSGMLGKITGITDKVVTVELADNVRVKMLKS